MAPELSSLSGVPTSEGLILAALFVGTLASEDAACVTAGLLVARNALGFPAALTSCFLGIFSGDLLLVMLGRWFGYVGLHRRPFRWFLKASAVRRAERWFTDRQSRLIFLGRAIPGLRLPTYFSAGILRLPIWSLAWRLALAAIVWVPLLVGTARIFGDAAYAFLHNWVRSAPALIAAILLAWILVHVAIALGSWRGRRLALSRWRRLTRWEFWPTWAIYLPIVPYLLWLGLRRKSLTLFTVTNPGIRAGGGLVGESKSEILTGLRASGDAVATWFLLPAQPVNDRMAALRTFMTDHELTYPIVLKPDVGERGSGVIIARNAAMTERAIAEQTGPLIVQAYVPGIEFGVFYCRQPSAEYGFIFAITEKRSVSVVGDGRRTLEELILADDRAVCMARYFLDTFSERLDERPAAGQRIILSELGTHSRGALFLDGRALRTRALELEIERISRSLSGFHFGRYDVRAASIEEFMAGRFKVIELNGLTSEATSMYDPAHSVWFGWRTLRRQWRIAFDIASEHRANGIRPLGLRDTWRLVRTRRVSPC